MATTIFETNHSAGEAISKTGRHMVIDFTKLQGHKTKSFYLSGNQIIRRGNRTTPIVCAERENCVGVLTYAGLAAFAQKANAILEMQGTFPKIVFLKK